MTQLRGGDTGLQGAEQQDAPITLCFLTADATWLAPSSSCCWGLPVLVDYNLSQAKLPFSPLSALVGGFYPAAGNKTKTWD